MSVFKLKSGKIKDVLHVLWVIEFTLLHSLIISFLCFSPKVVLPISAKGVFLILSILNTTFVVVFISSHWVKQSVNKTREEFNPVPEEYAWRLEIFKGTTILTSVSISTINPNVKPLQMSYYKKFVKWFHNRPGSKYYMFKFSNGEIHTIRREDITAYIFKKVRV